MTTLGTQTMPSDTTRRPRIATLFRAAALLATSLGLAGCGDTTDAFAPPCPQLSLLKNAADLTRFDGKGNDITDMEVNARLTAVAGACKPGDPGHVIAAIRVTMDLNRGPALAGRAVTVPYLVTVTEGGRILDQQTYSVTTSFPANVDKTRVTDTDITLNFPVTNQKTAAAYTIFVSYQLTPEQLAYNRAHAS
jgi:hypothetical protein